MARVQLRVEREDDVAFLILSGELVAGQGDSELRAQLDKLQEAGVCRVIVDLTEVPYFDSSVLGQLVHGHTVMSQAGGGLRLLKPAKRIMDLLSLTRLITVFEIFQNRGEALEGWRQ